MAESCAFTIVGVPPNWLNRASGQRQRMRERKEWLDRALIYARQARTQFSVPLATESDKRKVAITLHRVRMLDKDGAEASVKPIVDGLKRYLRVRAPGVNGHYTMKEVPGSGLIWDDDLEHCEWTVTQVKVSHYQDERVMVEVWA